MNSFDKPGGHRRRWMPEDDAELRSRCAAGEFLPDIARAMNRTQEACRSRANTLGVPCRSSAERRIPPRGSAL